MQVSIDTAKLAVQKDTQQRLLGVQLAPTPLQLAVPPSVLDKTTGAFVSWAQQAKTTFVGLLGLFTGKVSGAELVGPVGIASLGGQAAGFGWQMMLNLLVGLSLSVAIFNLLPLSMLDGGQLLYHSVITFFGSLKSVGNQKLINFAVFIQRLWLWLSIFIIAGLIFFALLTDFSRLFS